MPYTAITDRQGVKQAFEALRDAFRKEEKDKNYYENPRFYPGGRNDLWGAFEDQKENRYTIAFGRGKRKNSAIFHVSPPKEGDKGSQGRGLFVQDNKGNKYLTHSGHIHPPKKFQRERKDVSGQLEGFTDSQCWVDVNLSQN